MATIHDVFHVSQLKKCIKVPMEIVETQAIEIKPDLSYIEQPIQILDTKERVTRKKKIKMYKISSTELPNFSSNQFPNIIVQSFFSLPNLGTRFFLGGKAVTFR
jgi:hypothetical protein